MSPSVTRSALNHVFIWIVALLHLHIMLYKHSGTVKAGKLSGCPFKIASTFFGRHTAFITNSLLFRNPGAIMKVSMKSDMNTFFRSSNIVQYAMNAESLAEILKTETIDDKMMGERFNQNLDSFVPVNLLSDDERRKEKMKKLNNEALEVIVIGEYIPNNAT